MKTLVNAKHKNQIQAVIALALIFQTYVTLAENSLTLRKTSVNTIAVELSNTQNVAGFQFSINARGGIVLRSYEGTDRMSVAGMSLYQYAKDDSTLNVVILAPVRSSLPAGQGTIGKISFSFNGSVAADTARVFLSRLMICDADARALEVIAVGLVWSVDGNNNKHSADFALEGNYPNPFNPSTTIAYTLQKPATVRLAVYDVAGRQVNTIVSQYQQEGRYLVKWNADDGQGSKLASGMYFARLQVGDQVAVRKMIVTK
jgi:hypothetical protein